MAPKGRSPAAPAGADTRTYRAAYGQPKIFLADFIVREESGVVSREYGGHTMSVFSFCPLEVPQLK